MVDFVLVITGALLWRAAPDRLWLSCAGLSHWRWWEHCVGTDVFEFKKQATHLIRALSDNEGFVL